MKVMTVITPSRIDGKDTAVGEKRELQVENVHHRTKCIRLKFEGTNIEVSERELLKAISNATGNEFY